MSGLRRQRYAGAAPRTLSQPIQMHPTLVDIGLNLAHDSFDHDRDRVVEAAMAAGVRHMVITGSTLASSRTAIALARSNPQRYRATAGIHPHHAHEFHAEDLPALRTLLLEPEVGAAGECGLDYFRNFSPHEDQERVFRQQLELAAELGKPVFLHQRDAHDAFVAILREVRPRLRSGVAHCFTGDERELRDYLDLDLSIGITGWICDERRGHHLCELVRQIPADRLMLGPMRPTCCRGTCSRDHRAGAMSQNTCRTSSRPWRPAAAKPRRRWRMRRHAMPCSSLDSRKIH